MREQLERYLENFVDPTFEDYRRNSMSTRHAFIASLITYHAVDRAAYPRKGKTLVERWRKKSMEFMLVEIVALQFKHVMSSDVRQPAPKNAIRITHALGLDETAEKVELHHLYFLVRDAIKFLHQEAKTMK
jgi:hypothetical protein